MNRNLYVGAGFVALLGALGVGSYLMEKKATVEAAGGIQAPRFEVELAWPKPLPNHWIMGNVIGVSVDSNDHIWIIHRQGSLEAKETYAMTNPPGSDCCVAAPPVLEFDEAGNLIGHWGGPGQGYEWPDSNHGITVDYKGNVWIGGNGRGRAPGAAMAGGRGKAAAKKGAPDNPAATAAAEAGGPQMGYYNDNMVLKFTQDGKFLMQIGHAGQSKGSNDVENLKGPAKLFIDKKTDELYVADGYGNHRVIVFDANTGKYKRHWGAYGNKPDDTNLGPYVPSAPVAQQFRNPVHCAELSNDGLLYVCDRVNDRIQVFKPDGTFVKEAILNKNTLGDGSTWDLAFSKDPQQKYLFMPDGANEEIRILNRDTLQVLTSFGDGGRQPGEFYAVHSISIDSKGNLFTTETYRGQRIQKWDYKGVGTVTSEHQGILWPKNAMVSK